jgi:hypothetical protein
VPCWRRRRPDRRQMLDTRFCVSKFRKVGASYSCRAPSPQGEAVRCILCKWMIFIINLLKAQSRQSIRGAPSPLWGGLGRGFFCLRRIFWVLAKCPLEVLVLLEILKRLLMVRGRNCAKMTILSFEISLKNHHIEFVREKCSSVFPKRQTQAKAMRVCLVQYEPDELLRGACSRRMSCHLGSGSVSEYRTVIFKRV